MKSLKKCTVCGKVGKFLYEDCSVCREKAKKRDMYKSQMPRFNVVTRSK